MMYFQKLGRSTFLCYKCFQKNYAQNLTNIKHLSYNTGSTRPNLFSRTEKLYYGVGPIAASLLGYWQWQLQKESVENIKESQKQFYLPPVDFPNELDDLHNLINKPVNITGEFLHSKEKLISSTPVIINETGEYTGSYITNDKSKLGYMVITPFKLLNKNLIIFVNRGWVHTSLQQPTTRSRGQIEGVVTLSAVVKEFITGSPRMPKPKKGDKYYNKDTLQLVVDTDCGASPIYVEALSSVEDGPIGGQVEIYEGFNHMHVVNMSMFTAVYLIVVGIIVATMRFLRKH